MHGDEEASEGQPLFETSLYNPSLRKVIENPAGAFQKWKRGEITYLHMCSEFTKELNEARTKTSLEAAPKPEEEVAGLIG